MPVARRARAWIETDVNYSDRGADSVARRARAWIETSQAWFRDTLPWVVARRARAWIETRTQSAHVARTFSSPAARGRGLKQLQRYSSCCVIASPAARGRGLKHSLIVAIVRA